MTPSKIKVVCEYRAKNLKSPTDFAMEAVEDVQALRGVWNKNIVRWRLETTSPDFDKARDLRYGMNISFTEFDLEIPVVFVEALPEEEDDITIYFRMRKDDPIFPNNPNVLAYAGFPDGRLKGIIVIFDDFDWNLHGKEGYNMIVVLEHEIGHDVGMPHANKQPYREPNLMDPIYNANVKNLSRYDLEVLVGGYGARVYDNQEQHDRLETANRRQKERLIENAV